MDATDEKITAAEKEIGGWVRRADEAFRSQDYEACLRAGEELRQLTAETTEADEWVRRAADLVAQVASNLTAAEQALARGKFDVAERMCVGILARLKRDCTEAIELRHRIAWKRRMRNLWTLAAAAGCAVVVYAISLAPVYKLAGGDVPAPPGDKLRAFYTPLFWLHDHTRLRGPTETYARWWDAQVFPREKPARSRPLKK